jgi:hypothetical protein
MAGRERLEGDGALEGEVTSLVHDAHAPVAEHRLHLVARDRRQNHGTARGRRAARVRLG